MTHYMANLGALKLTIKHIIVDLEDIKDFSTQDAVDRNLAVAITALRNIIKNI